MAGKPREPIDLIKAKGKKHLSKKEYEDRKNSELQVPFTDVEPPDYLTKAQSGKFNDIAEKLLALGIMTELDVDCLAMYILSHDLYLEYTRNIMKMLKAGDLESVKCLQMLQDKAFRQALSAAKSLGLTITDRCKITIPPPPEEDEEL